MGRFTLMITIISVTLIVFHLAGLITNTPISWLLDFLVKPQNYGSFDLLTQIKSAIAVTVAAGMIAGTIISQRTEIAMVAAVASASLFILGDFVGIFLILLEIHVAIAILIVAPISLIYMITVVEWWRNRG